MIDLAEEETQFPANPACDAQQLLLQFTLTSYTRDRHYATRRIFYCRYMILIYSGDEDSLCSSLLCVCVQQLYVFYEANVALASNEMKC